MIERLEERQHVTGSRVVDVAARFVGLGFQRELEIILLVQNILTQEVHCLPRTLDGNDRVFGGVGLGPLAPAPEHIDLRAQLHTQVDGVHRFLQCIGAHFRVIGCKRAVLEGWVREQVGRRHGDDQPCIGKGLLEFF